MSQTLTTHLISLPAYADIGDEDNLNSVKSYVIRNEGPPGSGYHTIIHYSEFSTAR